MLDEHNRSPAASEVSGGCRPDDAATDDQDVRLHESRSYER
jgi:hypothetical protein